MIAAAELVLMLVICLRLWFDLRISRGLIADCNSYRRRIADLESAVYHLSPQEPAPHARHPLSTHSDN